MGVHRKLILDAILGQRDGEMRTSGYIDCRSEEDYAKAEDETRELITNLHPNGHLVANFFRIYKAPKLRE